MTPARVSAKLTGSQITSTVIEVKKAMTDITKREPNLSARYEGTIRPNTEDALVSTVRLHSWGSIQGRGTYLIIETV